MNPAGRLKLGSGLHRQGIRQKCGGKKEGCGVGAHFNGRRRATAERMHECLGAAVPLVPTLCVGTGS